MMMLRDLRAWLALSVLAVPAWGTSMAQTASAAEASVGASSVIADCAKRIDDAVTGLEELERRCPDLSSALQAAGIRPLIIASSRAQLDRQSLLRLKMLLHPALGAGPDVSQLDAILRGLRPPAPASRSWWQRLWDWIVKHLTGKEQPTDSWWGEFVRQAMAARWLWISLILCGLVALVTVVVVAVVREVRAGRAGRAASGATRAASGAIVRHADLAAGIRGASACRPQPHPPRGRAPGTARRPRPTLLHRVTCAPVGTAAVLGRQDAAGRHRGGSRARRGPLHDRLEPAGGA